ncbi:TetR/AcrR family transcriptional regulator [Streptomyces umbrinus]|uniref:TetR/AcrR family transcriptional regulator n=1 Tax=Streptomyces umbrinus TaxID=67370 RepID=UPI003C2B637B
MARPRDERIDHAVLSAVTELLRDVGYSGLTMEAIAQRAGTTKPAIRRRWKNQQHLVVEAMAQMQIGAVKLDTGCTHCDLVRELQAFQDSMSDPAISQVLPGLVADLADDAALRRTFLDIVWEPRRQACIESLKKGMASGTLRPGLDPDLLLDLLTTPIVVRALFGHCSLTSEFPENIVHTVLSGAGATPICSHERNY